MTTRIDELAGQIEAGNQDYLSIVGGCSDEQWSQVCPNEERTVAVVAHHMATVQSGLAGLVAGAMTGDLPDVPGSMDEIDQMNAEHAHDNVGVSQAETLEALRIGGDAFLTQVRSLKDEDLDRSVGVLVRNEMTIGQVIQFAIIAHQQEHLASIRGALA